MVVLCRVVGFEKLRFLLWIGTSTVFGNSTSSTRHDLVPRNDQGIITKVQFHLFTLGHGRPFHDKHGRKALRTNGARGCELVQAGTCSSMQVVDKKVLSVMEKISLNLLNKIRIMTSPADWRQIRSDDHSCALVNTAVAIENTSDWTG